MSFPYLLFFLRSILQRQQPNDLRNFDTDGNVLTERNTERAPLVAQSNLLYSNDEKATMRPETIYANSNVAQRNDGDGLLENALNNNAVPSGRKPALPPKPSSQVQTTSSIKNKGFLQFGRAAVLVEKNSTPNKRDPAEMSLKERLALFEKNKGTALIPKAALGMSVSKKQILIDKKCNGDSARIPLLSNKLSIKTVPIQQEIIDLRT